MRVRVLDALMGQGKSTKIMNDVSLLPNNQPVIYIAPLLSECHRFAGTQIDEEGEIMFDEYGNILCDSDHPLSHKCFYHPNNRNSTGTKVGSLSKLVKEGKNIVSTHSLFKSLTKEIIADIEKAGYLLIIDEVLCVWEKYVMAQHCDTENDTDKESTDTDKEIRKLINNGFIEVDVAGLLHWQWDKYDARDTSHAEVARLCDTHQLCIVNGSVVFWEYPVWALKAFKDIWVATYGFENSFMCEYFKCHDIDYQIERFGEHQSSFKHLITIVEDSKLNSCGDRNHSLSYTNITKSKTHNEALKNNLHNFFQNKMKAKVNERLWTVYSSKKRSISGGRYASSWLAYNTKATNDYKDATCVAYLINLNANLMVMSLLGHRGVCFDQDKWATSEMVQFIWRSAIRESKPITVYIPSKRMRELFVKWLDESC
jgi:hypothetical protein